MTVLVLDGQIPIDDRHGCGAFLDMKSLIYCLMERQIDGRPVVMQGRIQLEKKGVRAGIVPACQVLRHAHYGTAPNPAFLPVTGLQPFHAVYHHLGELVYGLVSLALVFNRW